MAVAKTSRISELSPDRQIAGAVRQWFDIVKVPHDVAAAAFVRQCLADAVELNGKVYKYYQRGNGPTIVLIHGLFGNLGSMVTIAQDLIGQGFKVVLFDAPAHGEAIGTSTDPVEIREVVRAIGRRLGEIRAIICHSLGVMWGLAAWSEDFRARTVISISGLSSKKYLIARFVERHQLNPEIAGGFIKELEKRFGEKFWVDWSPSEMVKTLDIPGLIIHGRADDVVPPAHAECLRANWRRARLAMIDGAGHFDIVGSPTVRQLIATYLREFKDDRIDVASGVTAGGQW